jgi:hypothetical protein
LIACVELAAAGVGANLASASVFDGGLVANLRRRHTRRAVRRPVLRATLRDPNITHPLVSS